MSSEVSTNGYSQLYNPIFCNLFSTNNGFNTCSNCNFSGLTVLNTSTQSGEQNCTNACQTNTSCTSYSYDTSSGSCTQYNTFPNSINYNVNGTNSGYLLNTAYDYTDLNAQQQNNVQMKCGDQYLNNYFINNNDVDLINCLSINTSGTNTQINADPGCIFNTYTANGLSTAVSNTSTYNNGTININATGDNTIDNYGKLRKGYLDSQVQIANINNKLKTNEGSDSTFKTKYKDAYKTSIKTTMAPITNSLNKIDSLIENFENEQTQYNNKRFFILLLFIIFIIFIFSFYTFKK